MRLMWPARSASQLPSPQLSELEARILDLLDLLGSEAYLGSRTPVRYEMLNRELVTEGESAAGQAFTKLHRLGFVQRTFLNDIRLAKRGEAWLGRQGCSDRAQG